MTACDFANSRVKARRSRLLGVAGIRELLGQRDLAARVEWLRRNSYGDVIAPELPARTPRDQMPAVERALRTRLMEDIEHIRRSLFESAVPLFDAMMAPIDAYDLKTILRAVGSGAHVEHVVSLLVHTPLLDENALAELVSRGDARDLHDVLVSRGSPFATPFAEVLAKGPKGGSLLALEAAIDQFALSHALETARYSGDNGRVCAEIVGLQIDLANAALLLKGVREPSTEEPRTRATMGLFLNGGTRLDARKARRLLTLDKRELAAALTDLLRLRDLSLETVVLSRPSLLDQVLLHVFSTAVSRLARTDPLSLAVPLAFLVERVMEARRIRLVLRGAEAGAPNDELLELVEVRPR